MTNHNPNQNTPKSDRQPASSSPRPAPNPPPSNLPALSAADADLFNRYASAHFDIDTFLKASNLTPAQFVRWASRPDIDAWVANFLHLLRRAREEAAELDRARALIRLRILLNDTATPPLERRRQLTVLNRTLSMRLVTAPTRHPALPHQSAAEPQAAPIQHAPPEPQPAPHLTALPRPLRTAALLAAAGAPPNSLTALAAA